MLYDKMMKKINKKIFYGSPLRHPDTVYPVGFFYPTGVILFYPDTVILPYGAGRARRGFIKLKYSNYLCVLCVSAVIMRIREQKETRQSILLPKMKTMMPGKGRKLRCIKKDKLVPLNLKMKGSTP